jgi:hypothetical protein
MKKYESSCGSPTAMFNPNKLSVAEFQFIKTYVAAMKRDYDVLASVMHLMDPKKLGVRCIVQATDLAYELQNMQLDFEAGLREIAEHHTFKNAPAKPSPTTDEVADLFTLSFFKVVEKTPKGSKDDGLFSGEPDSWQQVFKSLQDASKHHKLKDMMSFYAKALFNLFPKLPPVFPKDDPLSFELPPGSFETHSSYEYDDDEDDDDWPEGDAGPNDWFYDGTDDDKN